MNNVRYDISNHWFNTLLQIVHTGGDSNNKAMAMQDDRNRKSRQGFCVTITIAIGTLFHTQML